MLNNYIKTETYIIFDCGCQFGINNKSVIFEPDLHNPKHTIRFNCPATYKLLQLGLTEGVFQLGSPDGKTQCKKLIPTEMEHISALGAIVRPGCKESKDSDGINITTRYQRKKNGKMELSTYHPVVDNILASTYGECIYQEQSIEIAKQCAGFTLSEADSLRKCVTDDTMFVSKTRGWISIKELLETNYNDQFLVMDENGKQSWKKISKIWCTGKHDVMKIETNNGLSVKATKYHQFLTQEGWKARRRLQPDDLLVCANNIDFIGDDEIHLHLCMVIAGLVTEGYFVEENGAHFTNYDNSMMNTFCFHFEQYFGHKPQTNDPKVAHITEHDKKMINKYLSYGKSYVKRLPKEMMRTTKETCRKFLSFMLSAEGGVTEKTSNFEFSSSSEELVHQVQLLLKRFSIRSNIIKKNKSGYKNTEGKFVDCGPSYRLYINDIQDQRILLEELITYFPDYKIKALVDNINRKDDKNYSIHFVPPNIVKRLLNQYPQLGNYEGGSIYNKNITRKKFNRLCEQSGDKKWIEFSQGQHYYDSIESMSERTRQVLTYDFSIEDEDTPYIVANGIVIHNSIGKKIPEEMSKSKKLFMEKGKELGIFTEQQLEEIFGWIEASQRYQFNHCVLYNTFIRRMNTTNKHKSPQLNIGEMYKVRNDITYAKSIGRLALYKKWKLLGNFGQGLSLCSDGRIRPNIIKNILYSGKQPYFRINLSNSDFIECTITHKFPTPFGEKKLCELKIGDKLFYKGPYEESDFKVIQSYGPKKNIIKKHDRVTEGFMKGENNPGYTNGSYTEFQKNNLIIPRTCQRCGAGEEKRLELHHINGDRSNSTLDNLIRLCSSCHKKAEYAAGRTKIGEKGYPYELVEIISIIYQGIDDVYDVEMEGPNHNFVANNGIVTSNSHAWSYGLNSYVTAYEKAHFPVNFYKAWFANEDKRENYINFVNEAKQFNINVYPPDIRDFRYEFYIKKKHIYFGLVNIKGLVKKDIDAIARIFEEKCWNFPELGKTINWMDFLSVALENISYKTAEVLIRSGALDCFAMDRSIMFYQYERWCELTPTEKKKFNNHQDLIHFIRYLVLEHEFVYESKTKIYLEQSQKRETSKRDYKTELKKPIENRRLQKLRKILEELTSPLYNIQDTVDSIIFAEEDLLGVALTKHKTDEINNCAETSNCKEILEGKKGYNVLRVKVESCRPYKCKNGSTMAFIEVSDKTGQLPIIAFSEAYEEYQHLLTRGSVCFISGSLDKDSFLVKRVYNVS